MSTPKLSPTIAFTIEGTTLTMVRSLRLEEDMVNDTETIVERRDTAKKKQIKCFLETLLPISPFSPQQPIKLLPLIYVSSRKIKKRV
jgi:hypothetical protein